MDADEFRKWSVKAAEWGVDYRNTIRERPVRAQTEPGEIVAKLKKSPPENPHSMEEIFADFDRDIVPGMTHWQHPGFFAYFPANAAPASVVAEHLVNAMAAQCMLWQTSPAATEMETVVLDWLRQALGLPDGFAGVIQDSASSATLVAVLTMRERVLDWTGNTKGLPGQKPLRIYASDQVHTSIDRAIWVAGIGEDNLVRIPTNGPLNAMDPEALERKIEADKTAGFLPAGVITCVGGTSIGATDDQAAVIKVAKRHGLYVHVDAAWAGSAMICEEYRHYWAGVEGADSIVFNPHKWLGAQFDCAAHFIANPDQTVKTLAIQPEYLKTHGRDGLINYSEWSVPLGRRFRALKLWFLMRAYGMEGLRTMIRNHVNWAEELCEAFRNEPEFEITSEPMLSLFSFRHTPPGISEAGLDAHQIALVNAVNDDGRIYLTQTKVHGKTAIRVQVGQFECTRDDVMGVLDVVKEMALKLAK